MPWSGERNFFWTRLGVERRRVRQRLLAHDGDERVDARILDCGALETSEHEIAAGDGAAANLLRGFGERQLGKIAGSLARGRQARMDCAGSGSRLAAVDPPVRILRERFMADDSSQVVTGRSLIDLMWTISGAYCAGHRVSVGNLMPS